MKTVADGPFARYLRRHRLLAGLTQQELAERAHLSVRGISDLERGVNLRPRRETVRLLADALELDRNDRAGFEATAREAALPPIGFQPAHHPASTRGAISPLIGRETELAALDAYLCGTGHRALLFAGEPGIGKSRLLQEAGNRAAALHIDLIHGGCQRRSAEEPFAPLPQALVAWMDRHSKAWVRRLLKEAPSLVRFLPELSALLFAPTPALDMTPHQERRLMFRDIARAFGSDAGNNGVLLVLDDLQWAGTDLFDLLSALLSSAPNVRILAAYRDTETPANHPLARWIDELARDRVLMHVPLAPLSARETADLLDVLLPSGVEERALLEDRIVARSQGIPFFLISYAEGLMRGSVDPRHDIPWDLAQSIRQRLTVLPASSRMALEAAAVSGRRASPPLLAVALDMKSGDVLEALDVAYEAGLLIEDGGAPYQFRHDVVRDVVEGDLGAGRRATLHARIGAALEAQPGAQSELLAYHWSRTTDHMKAALYLHRAGDRAAERFALAAAASFYDSAVERLELLGEVRGSAEVRMKRSGVLTDAGRFPEALSCLEPAFEAYLAEGDHDYQARAGALMAVIYVLNGSAREGLARVQAVLAGLSSSRPTPGLAQLWYELARLLWHLGRYEEQFEAAQMAADIARIVDDGKMLARACRVRQDARHYLGGRPKAKTASELEGTGEWIECIDLMAGQFDLREHRGHLERAMAFARQRGGVSEVILSQQLLGHLLLILGEWDAARHHMEEALDQICDLGTSLFAPGPRMDLGWLALHEGDWEAASRWLHEALSLAADDVFVRRVIQGRLAVLDLLLHRPDDAITRLTPVLDRPGLEETQVTSLLPTLAWAHLELGDIAQAETLVNEAIRRSTDHSDRLDLLHGLLIRGRIRAREKRSEEAIAMFEQVAAIARELPCPYGEATALYEAALVLLDIEKEPEARCRLESALAIFQRLGARKDVECLVEQLARLPDRQLSR